jgi:hypothetical protein
MDAERRARAEARKARATLHKTHLSSEEQDFDPVVGVDAISLLTTLIRESWSLSGRDSPAYAREDTPCRLVPGRLT